MDVRSFALIFIGIGALSAIIAVYLLIRRSRFLANAVTVQGTVTASIARSGSEGGTVYSPQVQFTTPEGQSMEFVDRLGRNPPRFQPGDPVKVAYPPGNPQRARIPSGMWFGPIFAAIFAAGFIGAGIPVYLIGGDGELSPAGEGTFAPGILPTGVAPGGSVIAVQRGSGGPETVAATCAAIRNRRGGAARQVRLDLDDDTLTFTATPFAGPGAYTPPGTLRVGGSLFRGGGQVSGAVVFDDTEQRGTVNLVAGTTVASGVWDCTDT
jgi:hypothetical protein